MKAWTHVILLGLLFFALPSSAQDYILVGETYNAKVSKIDPVTNAKSASIRVADSIGVPVPNIARIVLDTVHNWVFVACNTGNAISVIDLHTWTATYPPISVPGMGLHPKGLAISADGSRLYAGTEGTDGVQDSTDPLDIISVTGNTFPPTLSLVSSVPCGKQPTNVVVSHDGKYAVVSCRNQARVAVVDLTGDSLIYRYNYPNTTYEPEGLDIHPTENLVYCTTHGQNTIDILNLDSMKIVSSIPISYTAPPPQPSGGVFSPDGKQFLLSAQTSGRLYFFNTTDPLNPVQSPTYITSGGIQPHMGVFLNDTLAYIPNTNNTQPVGSVAIVTTGQIPVNIGNVTGTFNGPLSIILVKDSTAVQVTRQDIAQTEDYQIKISPNPFHSSATLAFYLPRPGFVTLKIFDVLGKEIIILLNGKLAAGNHQVEFKGGQLPDGLYFCRLSTPQGVRSKYLELIK
ncbi:MAG: hypothetical protein A2293_04365 [Elusimicrobia bacterium RIFOXYB2_FULL_49_7]|nr:MAG: hypothetical protein A2293_04365 [Elusimicrobia bacterium RIFOXYB2_FULL_49_7]